MSTSLIKVYNTGVTTVSHSDVNNEPLWASALIEVSINNDKNYSAAEMMQQITQKVEYITKVSEKPTNTIEVLEALLHSGMLAQAATQYEIVKLAQAVRLMCMLYEAAGATPVTGTHSFLIAVQATTGPSPELQAEGQNIMAQYEKDLQQWL